MFLKIESFGSMAYAVLERGFLGRRAFLYPERILFPQTWEEFFKTIRDLKGELLLFYISFESGYELLDLKTEKKNTFPPFAVAVVEETSPKGGGKFTLSHKGSFLTKSEYLKRFKKIKGYIERGDIYQVNFTVRFDYEFEGDPLGLYEAFINRQEVPYGVFAHFGEFFIASGSMELFLQKEGERIVSKPIKGTLPITEDPKRFFEMEKELAENLMITDMVRNDLGKIAEWGSVKVEKLFGVETYKTLHQLVSTVSAKTGKGFEGIIRATFPPASVTGAPKRKAVEIIDELEPHPREVYCGTIGVIKPSGDFTCNVAIRTALGRGNEVFYYAGGGIVWDSDPLREWNEVNLKRKAFDSICKT